MLVFKATECFPGMIKMEARTLAVKPEVAYGKPMLHF